MVQRILLCVALLAASPLAALAQPATSAPTTQRASAFYPKRLLDRARANIEKDAWGKEMRAKAVELAEPWKKMSDEQLWKLMFGATLPRSWMVWSNGVCPSCKKAVPMYDWQIDALNAPWKLKCPHCAELFPKNDFAKFHESGLDEHGIFDATKADRSLLFNTEHPDPKDPLHTFGVDDGNGYVEGNNRWRFIPTYLVYGQWKQAVQLGIKRLATAYVISGDPIYAHKCAILLDRVADVYPAFDFKTQGILYESVFGDGYVSVWHDATIETREMTYAYDAIKEAIPKDAELTKFLVAKSARFKTPTPKRSAGGICLNIENRILRDALAKQHKIYSNYPQQYLTMAVIHTALGWPGNREEVFALLDPVIEKTTAVDGTTGEKGLAGYSAYAAQRFAEFLGYYARVDDTFIPEMVKRHPRLPQMWRFFIDTWCVNNKYYPVIGDTGYFAAQNDGYEGVAFLNDHAITATGHMSGVLAPSMYSFLWSLYETTKDPAFAQVLYKANDSKLDGLPYNLLVDDASIFQNKLKSVLAESGEVIDPPTVNKEQWHLAILRSGKGDKSRAAWLDYDAGGSHGHFDGLNLGLFAHGLDLMPDFGYPPVQFGGWDSQRAQWYVSTAAHNTVLVNGAQQATANGETTLWAPGDGFSAITASAPGLNPGVTSTFARTVAMIDTSADDAYVIDIFRVAGGTDHAKFFMSHFGTIEPLAGLATQPAIDFAHPQMRNFQVARNAAPGWSTTWNIEDRYKLRAGNAAPVHLRYTDFTTGADAYTCETWVVAGIYNSMVEAWLPRLLTRKRAADTTTLLASTFVSIIEPYSDKPLIASASRLGAKLDGKEAPDSCVAMAIKLADGRNDLVISRDAGAMLEITDAKLSTDAALAWVRTSADGKPTDVSLCGGKTLRAGTLSVTLNDAKFAQLHFDGTTATVVRGDRASIGTVLIDDSTVEVK